MPWVRCLVNPLRLVVDFRRRTPENSSPPLPDPREYEGTAEVTDTTLTVIVHTP
jgi:hypothetical protein